MKTEVHLAKAIKIEKGAQYIVIFESDRDEAATDIQEIKTQLENLFKEFGAKVKPIVVLDGHIKIAEVKKNGR